MAQKGLDVYAHVDVLCPGFATLPGLCKIGRRPWWVQLSSRIVQHVIGRNIHTLIV